MGALQAALASVNLPHSGEDHQPPLMLEAAKTVAGHCEAASGIPLVIMVSQLPARAITNMRMCALLCCKLAVAAIIGHSTDPDNCMKVATDTACYKHLQHFSWHQ